MEWRPAFASSISCCSATTRRCLRGSKRQRKDTRLQSMPHTTCHGGAATHKTRLRRPPDARVSLVLRQRVGWTRSAHAAASRCAVALIAGAHPLAAKPLWARVVLRRVAAQEAGSRRRALVAKKPVLFWSRNRFWQWGTHSQCGKSGCGASAQPFDISQRALARTRHLSAAAWRAA